MLSDKTTFHAVGTFGKYVGGALFEGFIVSEVWKSFYNRGKRPSVYFWRSQGGLEVDLLIEAKGKLWPVEIKLTSTPVIKHTNALNRFKEIAGADAAEQGTIVCRTNKKKSLPGNNIALPWNEFSEYLDIIVE